MSERHAERPPRAFCVFSSGPTPLGVELEAVVEVVEPDRLVRLPLCPRQILGLCTFRGGFVPVVMATGSSERAEPGDGRARAVMVLRTTRGIWGLAIDRDGVSVEDHRVPRTGDGPPILGNFVTVGTIERGGTTHSILDPGRTWQSLRTGIEHWYSDALGLGTPGGSGVVSAGSSDVHGDAVQIGSSP